jgi:alpha-1,2-mannosyltransferase
MRTALTAALLALSTAITAVAVAGLGVYNDKTGRLEPLVVLTLALWLLFGLSMVALRRVQGRAVVVLILAGTLAISAAAMSGPPNTSTDSARYAWDGIVQNAGLSPYRYVPTDPALADLRTDWLFPAPTDDGSCPGKPIMTSHEPGSDVVVCTAINRGTVPTIYPPASEILFAAVRLVVGPEAEFWPLQLVGLLLGLGTTVLLLRLLRARGLDPRWAALWGWCPLVATEGVTNSHVDMVAALLVVAATALVASGRRWRGGAALGAAIGAKLIPVIAAPALLGRRPLVVIAASVSVFMLLYLPYIASDGIGVLGYLPGYLSEEGYDSGDRFILASLIAPGVASTVLVATLLLITAVLVWRKTDPANPWLGQLVMIGVTLMAVSPRYPWYALLLVPMIAMTGRWEWFAVPLALTVRLLVPSLEIARLLLALAIVIVVAASVKRSGPGVLARMRRELRHPLRAPEPRMSVSQPPA